MLTESRLYSFIDQPNGFLLHFLEGQKLIGDLAVIHSNKNIGFQYFRDALLTFQLLVAYLKPLEGLGIYIDSDFPEFKLKIEMSETGQMRTLLLPEDFNEFPSLIKGKCRIVKTMPEHQTPYTSIIPLENVAFNEIVNLILKDSFQFKSKVFLSTVSDQSILLLKLPPSNVNSTNFENNISLDEYWKTISSECLKLFSFFTSEQSIIEKHFTDLKFDFLGSKEIKFKCHCTRERMKHGIELIIRSSGLLQVFGEENELETKCDYCKTCYTFSRVEF